MSPYIDPQWETPDDQLDADDVDLDWAYTAATVVASDTTPPDDDEPTIEEMGEALAIALHDARALILTDEVRSGRY